MVICARGRDGVGFLAFAFAFFSLILMILMIVVVVVIGFIEDGRFAFDSIRFDSIAS